MLRTMGTLKLPKPIAGEVLSKEDKEIVAKEGNDISTEERQDLIIFARSLGFSERAIVVRSFASQDYIKQQPLQWGVCTGFSWTTKDKIIEVQWISGNLKGTYQIDELEIIHEGMEFQGCKDKLNAYRERKKTMTPLANAVGPVSSNAHTYDLYAGFEE